MKKPKKHRQTSDCVGNKVRIGDLVFYTIYPFNFNSRKKLKPRKILAKLYKIDGAYHYLRHVTDKRQTFEVYSNEFAKAEEAEATLWLFENS